MFFLSSQDSRRNYEMSRSLCFKNACLWTQVQRLIFYGSDKLSELTGNGKWLLFIDGFWVNVLPQSCWALNAFSSHYVSINEYIFTQSRK